MTELSEAKEKFEIDHVIEAIKKAKEKNHAVVCFIEEDDGINFVGMDVSFDDMVQMILMWKENNPEIFEMANALAAIRNLEEKEFMIDAKIEGTA
jgi:predicted neutral ceramidase superfamily lipid hydrolase